MFLSPEHPRTYHVHPSIRRTPSRCVCQKQKRTKSREERKGRIMRAKKHQGTCLSCRPAQPATSKSGKVGVSLAPLCRGRGRRCRTARLSREARYKNRLPAFCAATLARTRCRDIHPEMAPPTGQEPSETGSVACHPQHCVDVGTASKSQAVHETGPIWMPDGQELSDPRVSYPSAARNASRASPSKPRQCGKKKEKTSRRLPFLAEGDIETLCRPVLWCRLLRREPNEIQPSSALRREGERSLARLAVSCRRSSNVLRR